MDELLNPEEEREALAAELALGVLHGEERANARRLMLSDRAFAAQVRDWEYRLNALHAESAEAAVPEALWESIASRIDAPPALGPLQRRLRFWQAGAVASGAIAAALALILVTRPVPAPIPVIAAPQVVAVARIENAEGGQTVLARYDQASSMMTLRIAGFDAGALVPELWVIPAGGDPVSLGQIARSGVARMMLSAQQRPLLRDGATLAITLEPASPVPHPAPSSAPVAAGKIMII